MLKLIVFTIIIVMFTSCSSEKKVIKSSAELDVKKELKNNKKMETTKVYFLNDKEKYPLISKNSQIELTREVANKLLYTKEYDFNSDGKIDMMFIYNNKKEIVRVYSDLDFDLKHDVIDYYKNNKLYKRELISDITQKPYIVIIYDKNNKIIQTLFDKNLDGIPDYKELYKNGSLYEIQIDNNYDGKFNLIKKITTNSKEEDGK